MDRHESGLWVDGVRLDVRPERELLPARAFTSTALFELELEHLFEQSWGHVADLADLKKPGDYVSGAIGRVAVFVVRDEAGELRGFVNACAHRGATLAEGRGNCGKHLRCPYHAWTYGTDGRLTGVPYREEFAGRLEGLALRPIRLAVLGPCVFGCLDERAPSFEGWAGELLLAEFAELDGAALEPAYEATYDIPVNWKVYVETALDGYHVQFVHDILPGVLGRMLEGHNELGQYASKTVVPLDMNIFAGLPGFEQRVRASDTICFGSLLPSFVPVFSPFEFTYLRIDPVAVDRMRLVGRSFDRGGAAAASRELRHMTFERTNRQDIDVVSRVQRGLAGNAAAPSVYAENLEARIGHFERAVVRELVRGLSRAVQPANDIVALTRPGERGVVRTLTRPCAGH